MPPMRPPRRWAEQALKQERPAWYLHVLGLALYRAGRTQRGDEATRRVAPERLDGTGLTRLVLAMIHHRQGHPAEARRLLDEARGWAASHAKAFRTWQEVPAVTDLLEDAVLIREAESLIGGAGTPGEPQPTRGGKPSAPKCGPDKPDPRRKLETSRYRALTVGLHTQGWRRPDTSRGASRVNAGRNPRSARWRISTKGRSPQTQPTKRPRPRLFISRKICATGGPILLII